MTRHRVIVVDDEPELRLVLQEYLGKHDIGVRTAASGNELDILLAAEPADLIVLDVNMPGEDGIAITRRLRGQSGCPILMLTAASDLIDRVVGLEIGADDYVTKPFELREVLARIRAILRRAADHAQPPEPTVPPPPPGIRFGTMTLDLQAHCLVGDDGEQLELTAMEFDLLHAFAQNPNRVLTRERLLDLAHSRGMDPFDRSIDVRIARIRRKVEVDPAKPQLIRTMRGAGYMFVPARA